MADPVTLLRAQLARLLDWEDAHVGFEKAVADIPPEMRGRRPAGSPHSLWELLEHIRITQGDILSFCRDAEYVELEWPREYWPPAPAPPTADVWETSIAAMRRDRAALQQLVTDPAIDLFARTPHGNAPQTYLREVLVVADHNSHHLGQLVLTRRLLGIWPPAQ
jgi:uncharacterized damage-inducible protein DinB